MKSLANFASSPNVSNGEKIEGLGVIHKPALFIKVTHQYSTGILAGFNSSPLL